MGGGGGGEENRDLMCGEREGSVWRSLVYASDGKRGQGIER